VVTVKTVAEHKEDRKVNEKQIKELQEKARKYDELKIKYDKVLKENKNLQEAYKKMRSENAKLTVKCQQYWAMFDAQR